MQKGVKNWSCAPNTFALQKKRSADPSPLLKSECNPGVRAPGVQSFTSLRMTFFVSLGTNSRGFQMDFAPVLWNVSKKVVAWCSHRTLAMAHNAQV